MPAARVGRSGAVSCRCGVQAGGEILARTAPPLPPPTLHPPPPPLQGQASSATWLDVSSIYIVTTAVSFVIGTVADISSASPARRLPFTFVAVLIFILKLDDLSSHKYGISWGIVFVPPFLLSIMFSLYIAFLFWLYVFPPIVALSLSSSTTRRRRRRLRLRCHPRLLTPLLQFSNRLFATKLHGLGGLRAANACRHCPHPRINYPIGTEILNII